MEQFSCASNQDGKVPDCKFGYAAVRVGPRALPASLAQLVEATGLSPVKCEFESHMKQKCIPVFWVH